MSRDGHEGSEGYFSFLRCPRAKPFFESHRGPLLPTCAPSATNAAVTPQAANAFTISKHQLSTTTRNRQHPRTRRAVRCSKSQPSPRAVSLDAVGSGLLGAVGVSS